MILGVLSYLFSKYLTMQHIVVIIWLKLIKITITYIKWAYTTDKLNHINWIPLLQEWWRWHWYSHHDYLCLNIHQVTFDYSTLEAHISTTVNDRNKQISDSESRHLEDYILLWGRSICTNNMHVQRDAEKHCFIYPYTWYTIIIWKLDLKNMVSMLHHQTQDKPILV